MALNKRFKFVQIENNKWLKLEDFIVFLRRNVKPTDIVTRIRVDNIKKECVKFNGTKCFDNVIFISAFSAIKYIFNHADQISVCSDIADEIIELSLGQGVSEENEMPQTTLDLYHLIVRNDIKDPVILPLESGISDLSTSTLVAPTLVDIHKFLFTSEQWQKICLFEHNFSLQYCPKESTSVETLLQEKWKVFSALITAAQISKYIGQSTKLSITRRKLRRKAASEANQIQVNINDVQHLYGSLDSSITDSCQQMFGDSLSHLVCVQSSEEEVEVYVELKEEAQPGLLDYMAQRISYELSSKHSIICSKVSFFSNESFSPYCRANDEIARFTMRDDILCHKLKTQKIWEWHPLDHSVYYPCDLASSSDVKCEKCFNIDLPTPLCPKTFNVLNEWLCDVPIEVQVLFESFINKRSLKSMSHDSVYLRSQVQKLYLIYDMLLNISNFHHSGIIQDQNTQDLLMNYHSIGSVFEVTSKMGITRSLKTAESQLKLKSIDDACYYETFIKSHPLKYETLAGLVECKISIRKCLVILMLDNLVRLKTKEDPDPGESRSKQICTIPLTLQGLPKDAVEIEKWHKENICDGEWFCPCKKSKTLSKSDFKTTLLECTSEERCQKNYFETLCTWGASMILQQLNIDQKDILFKLTPETESQDGLLPEFPIGNDGLEVSEFAEHFDTISNHGFVNELELSVGGQLQVAEQGVISELEQSLDTLHLEDIGELEIETEVFEMPSTDTSVPTNESLVSDHSSYYSETDSIIETENNLPSLFCLQKYAPPPLLCRRPPAATGRDDDILKLKEILDDILLKMGHYKIDKSTNRILCGPDNKILNNLLKLQKQSNKYKVFLPEFPLLHLRKSKINTLFSAYKDAGLMHLLKYMRDDNDDKDWGKLVSIQHIDIATKNVRRLGQSLHLALLLSFQTTLSADEKKQYVAALLSGKPRVAQEQWQERYDGYIKKGKQCNATFALHIDMMSHCDEVVAIYMAERMGGVAGYNLLTATVKESLLFQYLNGASSYAPLCTKLLHEHYSAGPFYQGMKHCLFSTPIGNSNVNFATDSKREMEHLTAVKLLRAGTTEKAAKCRLSLIDSLNEVQSCKTTENVHEQKREGLLNWSFSDVDVHHIYRTASLILRRNGLSIYANDNPCNMYSLERQILSPAILDEFSKSTGEYLLTKYVIKEQLFGYTSKDLPDFQGVTGPKDLLTKLKASKGVTIKRVVKQRKPMKTSRDLKEEKRKRVVTRENKKTDCLSSEMNNCQALVKPDCSKPKVLKSVGMQKALLGLVTTCILKDAEAGEYKLHDDTPVKNQFVFLEEPMLPTEIRKAVSLITVEFAGVKFKTKSQTGDQYLLNIEKLILKPLFHYYENIERIVICEEKYQYTPDDFKAATRQQRVQKKTDTISHLKVGEEIISRTNFDRQAVTSPEGKCLISTYLAKFAHQLQIEEDIVIDIDSELEVVGCKCAGATSDCNCNTYAVPIRCHFSKQKGFEKMEKSNEIKQRKGEAELAQVDWLIHSAPTLKEGQVVVSVVTSGDIDAVPIHLFALSYQWPRDINGKFKNRVYVILQKANAKNDVYDITSIIELLERVFDEKYIAMKIALCLCLGGNDFVPKFYGKSHDTILKLFLGKAEFLDNLFVMKESHSEVNFEINKAIYVKFVMHLYCPKQKDPDNLDFDRIRQLTMYSSKIGKQVQLRNPQLWLPPETVLNKVADLIDLQIEYLQTAGKAAGSLPDFLGRGCLIRTDEGKIEYNFGVDSQVELNLLESRTVKRQSDTLFTPTKAERKKRSFMCSTPKK